MDHEFLYDTGVHRWTDADAEGEERPRLGYTMFRAKDAMCGQYRLVEHCDVSRRCGLRLQRPRRCADAIFQHSASSASWSIYFGVQRGTDLLRVLGL